MHHLFAVPDAWCTPRGRALFAGGACSGLFIGAVCGWAAIAGVLLPDGVFSDTDKPESNLLVIYSVAICAMSLSGTPAGLLCDRAPPLYGVAAAGGCVVLSSLAIGLLPSSSGFAFLPPFVLLAIGGNTCFFAATKLGFLFPKAHRAGILATICALYDASSAVSLLFFLAYQIGFSRAVIFTAYATLGAILFGSWAWTVSGIDAAAAPAAIDDGGYCGDDDLRMKHASAGDDSAKPATAARDSKSSPTAATTRPPRANRATNDWSDVTSTTLICDTSANQSPGFTRQVLDVASVVSPSGRRGPPSASPLGRVAGRSLFSTAKLEKPLDVKAEPLLSVEEAAVASALDEGSTERRRETTPSWGSVPELHGVSLLDQLTSGQLIVGLSWYLLSQQRVNLYLGTARSMLAAQGDSTGYYTALHTALLPAGLAFVPVIAHAHARYGVIGTMQLTTLMGAAHGLCAVWLPLDWQPVTFCLFTCLRMATFATFSIYTAEAFGPAASATLTGFIFLVGGLASLSLMPIGFFVADRLDGDWSAVFHVYTALCLPQLGLLGLASWHWHRVRRRHIQP